MNRVRSRLSVSQEQANSEFVSIPDTPDYVTNCPTNPPTSNRYYSDSEPHRSKIRWGNVRPLNATRAKLDDPEHHYACNDFIEANWVTLGHNRKVIVSSAPVRRMFGQWWAMVFLKNVTHIYCLTRDVEKNMPKMDIYWPLTVGETIYHQGPNNNDYLVETEECECLSDDLIMRRVRVVLLNEHGESLGERAVIIYHYTGWPDFGVPSNTSEVAQIVTSILNTTPSDTVAIHCSAGRGRSGVVVGALRSLLTNEPPAISVAELRKERTGIVQTGGQYHFLKRLVNELLLKS